jgi:hypothetical protein
LLLAAASLLLLRFCRALLPCVRCALLVFGYILAVRLGRFVALLPLDAGAKLRLRRCVCLRELALLPGAVRQCCLNRRLRGGGRGGDGYIAQLLCGAGCLDALTQKLRVSLLLLVLRLCAPGVFHLSPPLDQRSVQRRLSCDGFEGGDLPCRCCAYLGERWKLRGFRQVGSDETACRARLLCH